MDFFVIGFPKCGTTSLISNLARLPGVNVVPGEPTLEVVERASHRPAGVLRGIKNPSIIYDLDRWHAFLKDAKIIICYRDPAEYIDSYFSYRKSEHPDSGMTLTDIISNGKDFYGFNMETVCFHNFVRRVYEKFSFDKVLILPLEMLKQEPQKYYRLVFKFLGLEVNVKDAMAGFERKNRTTKKLGIPAELRSVVEERVRVTREMMRRYIDRSITFIDGW
jgi:hypothetical protein